MTPAQAKNMLFTLRYPPDKILKVYEGSFTAAQSASTILSQRTHEVISQDFGKQCLLELVYSLNGGLTWQDMDQPIPDTSSPTPVFQTITVAPFSSTTDFTIVAVNQTTSPATVDYIMTASNPT